MKSGSQRRQPTAILQLNPQEAKLLVHVATHYQRAMGPMRFLVRLTAPAEIKAKYRFVSEESRWLKRFAQATYDQMQADRAETADVSFTPSALIAFWGRLLTSLNSRRSRRRMSHDQVRAREGLAAKVQEAALSLWKESPEIVDQVLETRRPTEAEWIRQRLGPQPR